MCEVLCLLYGVCSTNAVYIPFVISLFLLLHRAIKIPSDVEWQKTNCSKVHGFIGEQYKICRRSLPIMRYVSEAAEMTKTECKSQLQNRRWNCTTISQAPSFYNDLKRGKLQLRFCIVCFFVRIIPLYKNLMTISSFEQMLELDWAWGKK